MLRPSASWPELVWGDVLQKLPVFRYGVWNVLAGLLLVGLVVAVKRKVQAGGAGPTWVPWKFVLWRREVVVLSRGMQKKTTHDETRGDMWPVRYLRLRAQRWCLSDVDIPLNARLFIRENRVQLLAFHA